MQCGKRPRLSRQLSRSEAGLGREWEGLTFFLDSPDLERVSYTCGSCCVSRGTAVPRVSPQRLQSPPASLSPWSQHHLPASLHTHQHCLHPAACPCRVQERAGCLGDWGSVENTCGVCDPQSSPSSPLPRRGLGLQYMPPSFWEPASPVHQGRETLRPEH